jgi:hypothetical protein
MVAGLWFQPHTAATTTTPTHRYHGCNCCPDYRWLCSRYLRTVVAPVCAGLVAFVTIGFGLVWVWFGTLGRLLAGLHHRLFTLTLVVARVVTLLPLFCVDWRLTFGRLVQRRWLRATITGRWTLFGLPRLCRWLHYWCALFTLTRLPLPFVEH